MVFGMSKPRRPPVVALRAVIYLRVSTEEQARSGLGRDAQAAVCQAHAARAGLAVEAIHFDDGLSGTLPPSRRPGLLAAIEDLRAGGGVFLVYSVSRLARSQRQLWELVDDRAGLALPVVSATEPFDVSTPMGRAFLGMLATFATLEADLASERTKDALAAAQGRGVRLGAPSMAQLAPEAVRQVRELYATGAYSHRSLAEHLNASGVPTAKGARWWPKTVRAALQGG